METQPTTPEDLEATELPEQQPVPPPESPTEPPLEPPTEPAPPEPPDPEAEHEPPAWEDVADEGPVAPATDDGVEDNSPEAQVLAEGDAASQSATTEPVVGGKPIEVDPPDVHAMECQICGRLYTGIGLGAGMPNCGHSYGNYRPVVVVKQEA